MDKKLLMMALLMTTGLATQAQERLTQYQVRNAITIRTPIMNDSINPKGEKHTASDLSGPVGAFHQRRIENGERCCGRQYLQSSNQRNCPTPGTGNGL